MSFIKDLLLGEEATPARIEDIRSPEQIAAGEQNIGAISDIVAQGGLPGFTGPTTAPITGLESDLIARLGQMTSGTFPGVGTARETLRRQAAGESINPILRELGLRPEEAEAGFGQVFDLLSGRTQRGGPELQAAIAAATRPITEQFGEATEAQRNLFTQAGQFVQPGASSPFELAQSKLSVGLANALGDVGSRMAFQNLQSERGRQSDLINMLSGAFESGEGRATTAAAQTVPFEAGQLNALSGALETAALPRLIEQFGISQGQEEFSRQQDTLLKALQLAFQGNQPQTVSIPGSPGGGGLLAPIATAAGTAFGGPAGAALAGKIFG